MSSFNLAKELLPAKKAWKRLTKTLQSKLQNLKISKTVKKITHRLKSLRSIRGLIPRKLRALAQSGSRHRHQHHLHHYQLHKNFAAIYVEDLFAGPVSSKAKEMGSTSSAISASEAKVEAKTTVKKQALGVNIIDERGLSRERKASESSTSGVGNAWKAKISSLPQLQGIDERAEEFISKFRKDMNLQREQSIIDFEEMLARSA